MLSICLSTSLFAEGYKSDSTYNVVDSIYSNGGLIIAPWDDFKIYTQNYQKDVTDSNGYLQRGVYLIYRKNKYIGKILISNL